MASMISGFEYDLFISYRQKDNKGDHWVTEFITALKTELEATFKEDLTTYFDENPYDGLLETHDVTKSLQGKLKCLIFIPILSQTYCDSKSFAWNYEFLAFSRSASKDQFGLEVKLPNGNVASRVLPVRIHEIDALDQVMLEEELHGTLRCVDFIYHAAGVNRPLRPDDDKVRDNESKTVYRNQINKVANAIKELMKALKNRNDPVAFPSRPVGRAPLKKIKSKKSTILLFSAISALAVLGYLFFAKSAKTPTPSIDRSIAVLPFQNMSNDPDQEYFSDGMMEEIINQLTKVKELQVTSRTSSMKYKGSKAIQGGLLKDIALELGVTNIVEGSVRTSGDQMRIAVQLIDARSDKHLWSETYDKPKDVNSIFAVQTEIALKIAGELKTILTPSEEHALQQIPTRNLEAYQLYLRARQVAQDREMESILQSISLIRQALDLDPNFTQAKCELANAYLVYKDWSYPNSDGFYENAQRLAKEVIDTDPTQTLAYSVLSSVDLGLGKFKEFRMYLKRTIENNPTDVEILHRSATSLAMVGEKQQALALIEKALKSDPFSPIVNHNYLRVLLYNREYQLASIEPPEVMDRIPEYSVLRSDILEQYKFETGKCDSLQSAFNQTLCWAIKGDGVKAKEELSSLTFGDNEEGRILKAYFTAIVHHDADLLFQTLHGMWKDVKMRSSLSYMKTDPVYDPYRIDPRYPSFLKEIGLED